MEIICENFEQKKIIDNKIIADEPSEEYYIIPLTQSFTMESDDEIIKLVFNNQLLWLKYSNRFNEILLKEFDFKECVLIKSEWIYDIFIKLDIDNYLRKNVWQSRYVVSMNKQYLGKYFLVLPIIDGMIKVKTVDDRLFYHVELITNEVVLKKVLSKHNNHGYVGVDGNFLLNKEALFVCLDDVDVGLFTGY